MRLPILRSLTLSIALSGCVLASGQDLIYSLADFMPTWTNPALTGAFEGTVRLGGLYRDQSRGFNTEAFQTPGFYVDAPLLTVGKKKKAWLGAGATLIADTKGVAALSSTYAELSVGFHRIFAERKASRSVFSIGLRGGVLQRKASLDSEQIILSEEQDVSIGGGGLGMLQGLDRAGSFTGSGVDIGLGASLARTMDEDREFRVGLTAHHVLAPKATLVENDYRRVITFGAQAQYSQVLSSGILIEPALYAHMTDGVASAQLQTMVGFALGEEGDKIFKIGAGFRAPRQAYPMVGFEKGDLRIAVAFDIYTGGPQGVVRGFDGNPDVPVNDKLFNSAFEIAAQYIIKIYKEPKVEPVILCPQI